MISSIHSIFNKKIIDYVVKEEGESVTQEDIENVEAEIIEELEELYEDDDYDVDEMEEELI
jgi:hypothetical protein